MNRQGAKDAKGQDPSRRTFPGGNLGGQIPLPTDAHHSYMILVALVPRPGDRRGREPRLVARPRLVLTRIEISCISKTGFIGISYLRVVSFDALGDIGLKFPPNSREFVKFVSKSWSFNRVQRHAGFAFFAVNLSP